MLLSAISSLPVAALAMLSAPTDLSEWIQQRMGDWTAFYRDLHTHPELSFFEERTAAKLAETWRAAGFEVTEKVGGHGIVGVLENGPGPIVMLRTDLDGLPLVEETGLPYASKVRAELEGQEVGVMHACGHDLHMTVVTGAAEALATHREGWKGTLLVIGQPAEERGAGATAMLEDGLFERFPRPNKVLGLHVDAKMVAGDIGYTPGFVMANVDSVDITVRGRGGHGAAPHETKDPIILAARITLALQTIVSRELSPTDPAVVTVGSIHGGSKHNLISNRVDLQLTVRSYSQETREHILAAIRRICQGIAISAGLPEELLPTVTVRDEFTPSLWNDPDLVKAIVPVFESVVGKERVHLRKPELIGEDFARYGMVEPKVPIFMFRLGAAPRDRYEAALGDGTALPGLHSPRFAPDAESTIAAGVEAMTKGAMHAFSH